MYPQLKQFYKTHQEKINVVGGVAVSAAAILFAKKYAAANSIRSCDYFQRPDGSSMIIVYMKNGVTKAFSNDS